MIAADVITGGNERHRLQPMVTAAGEELQRAGVTDTPEVALADAGYWNSPHIEQLAERGIRALVKPDADSRESPTRARGGPPYEQMRQVLAGEEGRQLYRQRVAILTLLTGVFPRWLGWLGIAMAAAGLVMALGITRPQQGALTLVPENVYAIAWLFIYLSALVYFLALPERSKGIPQ